MNSNIFKRKTRMETSTSAPKETLNCEQPSISSGGTRHQDAPSSHMPTQNYKSRITNFFDGLEGSRSTNRRHGSMEMDHDQQTGDDLSTFVSPIFSEPLDDIGETSSYSKVEKYGEIVFNEQDDSCSEHKAPDEPSKKEPGNKSAEVGFQKHKGRVQHMIRSFREKIVGWRHSERRASEIIDVKVPHNVVKQARSKSLDDSLRGPGFCRPIDEIDFRPIYEQIFAESKDFLCIIFTNPKTS